MQIPWTLRASQTQTLGFWPRRAFLPGRALGAFGRADRLDDLVPPVSQSASCRWAGVASLAQGINPPRGRRAASCLLVVPARQSVEIRFPKLPSRAGESYGLGAGGGNTLSGIESDFVNVLSRMRRLEKLNLLDRARLCLLLALTSFRCHAG